MRTRLYGIVTLILLLTIGLPSVYGQEVLDRIVAVVENEVILQSDLDDVTQMWILQSQQRPQNQKEFIALQHQLLQQMIDGRIIIAVARRDSMQVTPDQVDADVKRYIDQMQQQYGSQEAVEKELAKAGLTFRDWNRMLRKQKEEEILQRRLEEKRFGTVRVTGAEVEQFYAAHKDSIPARPTMVTISHIMMSARPSEETDNKAIARIQEIQKQLKAGADFADLAQKYSEDLASAKKGGDLGAFTKGEFVREFEEAAFALQPGQVSDIAKTSYGYHLIKLESKEGDRAHARHILIQLQTTPDDEKRTVENLMFLRQRILEERETFADAAKKYSEDVQSNSEGGSLGEFPIDQLQPQYRTVIEKMNVGDISEPIKVDAAYHMFRLDNKIDGKRLTIPDDWDDIAKLAKNYKWQTERRRWLDELRNEVHLEEHGVEGQ